MENESSNSFSVSLSMTETFQIKNQGLLLTIHWHARAKEHPQLAIHAASCLSSNLYLSDNKCWPQLWLWYMHTVVSTNWSQRDTLPVILSFSFCLDRHVLQSPPVDPIVAWMTSNWLEWSQSSLNDPEVTISKMLNFYCDEKILTFCLLQPVLTLAFSDPLVPLSTNMWICYWHQVGLLPL